MVKQRSRVRDGTELVQTYTSIDRAGYTGPLLYKPRVHAHDIPFAPGFYLFSGPTGSGKSTLSLALALVIADTMRSALSYRYMLEPRSDPKGLAALVGLNSAEETASLLRSVASDHRYVVLDSVTYLLPALGKKLMGDQEDVTMKEGLRRSDILGVLSMDNLCREHELTVVGTINSELFPRTEDLEGACEGSINISAAGATSIAIRDRLSRRRNTLTLPDEAVLVARRLLGYVSTTKIESTSLLGKAL